MSPYLPFLGVAVGNLGEVQNSYFSVWLLFMVQTEVVVGFGFFSFFFSFLFLFSCFVFVFCFLFVCCLFADFALYNIVIAT